MPNIVVDVWYKLHDKSLRDVNRNTTKNFEERGKSAAEAFNRQLERGLLSGNTRVRKAAERLADATASAAAKNKLLADSQRRVAEESRTVADLQDKITESRRRGLGLAASLARDENALAAARRAASKADRDFVRDSADVERAMTRRTRAVRDFEDAMRSSERTMRNRHRGRGGQAANSLGGVFTSIPFVPGGKAGAVIGTGLVTVLGSVADAAVTASQALWLLPAAALAGGAAFATLKIGLGGFGKALQDMGDAKKFAQDLQGLAPNAQQAALEIQALSKAVGGLKTLVQNKLFEGVAQQLHNLGNTFLPTLKNMFSGVAGAFNQMFQGATNQLMTPGTASNIASIVDNIVGAFRNLAPAMGPVVDAFTKIAQVGSTFLPGMGTALTNLATKFDDFITKAQQSGQLQQWIQKGIDAASSLGKVIGEIAHKIYDVFGNKSPQQFQNTLQLMVDTATDVARAIQGISQVVNRLVQDLQPVATAFGGWPKLIEDVAGAWALWKVGGTLTSLLGIGRALLGLPKDAEIAAGGISKALAGITLPAWLSALLKAPGVSAASVLDILGTGGNQDPATDPMKHNGLSDADKKARGDAVLNWAKANQGYIKAHGGPPGGMKAQRDWQTGKGPMPSYLAPYYHAPAPAPGKSAGKPSWYMAPWFGGGAPGQDPYAPIMPPSAGLGPWSPIPVPDVPQKGKKGKLPKAYTPYGSDFTAPPRPGETPEEYSAEGEVLNAKHRLEQDRQTLLELEKDNNATADEIQAQKNKIVEDQRQQYEAELRLQKAQQNAVDKNIKGLKKANDEFNNIDQDFGLSQGLPGLVKNLVGMIGDLAAAPLMGQLNAIANAYGTGSDQFGAFGMSAAGNRSKGLSPLLGIAPGMPGGPSLGTGGEQGILGEGTYGSNGSGILAMPAISGGGAGAGLSTIGAISTPEDLMAGGARVSALYSVAEALNGTPYSQALRNDCSGMVSQLTDAALGLPLSTPRFNTRNEGQFLFSHGFRPGIGPPGSFRVGWYNDGPGADQGHTAATLPNGMNAESGGSHGNFLIGPGAAGANNPEFTNHAWLPMSDVGLMGYTRPNGAHSGILATSYKTQNPFYTPTISGDGTAAGNAGGGGAPSTGRMKDFAPRGVPGSTGPIPGQPPIPLPGHPDWGQMIHGQRGVGYRTAGDYGGVRLVDKATPLGAVGGAAGFPAPGAPGAPSYMAPARMGPDLYSLYPSALGNAGIGLGKPPTIPGHAAGSPVLPAGGPRPRSGAAIPPPGGTGAPPQGIANAAPPAQVGPPPNQGWQPAGGGANGIGGLPEAAIIAGASMFPGGGAAAQTGMKLINRTIGYGQQAAAIGMEGLLQTFGVHDPDGGDGGLGDLSKSWFGRVLAGFAGARPAIGSGAGKKQQAKKSPQDEKGGTAGKPSAGSSSGVSHVNNGPTVHMGPGSTYSPTMVSPDNGVKGASDNLNAMGTGLGGVVMPF